MCDLGCDKKIRHIPVSNNTLLGGNDGYAEPWGCFRFFSSHTASSYQRETASAGLQAYIQSFSWFLSPMYWWKSPVWSYFCVFPRGCQPKQATMHCALTCHLNWSVFLYSTYILMEYANFVAPCKTFTGTLKPLVQKGEEDGWIVFFLNHQGNTGGRQDLFTSFLNKDWAMRLPNALMTLCNQQGCDGGGKRSLHIGSRKVWIKNMKNGLKGKF